MANKNDNGQKRVIGRGSLLQRMQEQQLTEKDNSRRPGLSAMPSLLSKQETVSSIQKADTESQFNVSTLATIGHGRGSLLSQLHDKEGEVKPLLKESLVVGRGRASLLGLVKKITSSGQPLMAEQESTSKQPLKVKQENILKQTSMVEEDFTFRRPLIEEQNSNLRKPYNTEQASAKKLSSAAEGETVLPSSTTKLLGSLSKLSVCKTASNVTSSDQKSQVISRQGTSGREVDIFSNYINLKLDPGKKLFEYEVKFDPDIDSRALRRKLLNQHAAAFGQTKSFDGVILYLPHKLQEATITYKSDHPLDGSKVTLTLIFKKQQKMSENVQFFNILLGRIMKALSLVRIGRQNFNPRSAHAVPQHRLEVWPGYVTAINEYEGGLKLCIDVKHRVMRMETVRDLMIQIHTSKPQNYKDYATMEIVGSIVLTRYNNKTYRIDDIVWDKNPMLVFERRGTPITILDYYKTHWNLEIRDKNQPLLLHRAKEKTTTGETKEKPTLLVPELCYIAGLTDNVRTDFRIMKDLDAITKVSPNHRRDVIKKFVQEIKKNELTRDILSAWGLQLDDELTQLKGRVLGPEYIYFGNNKRIHGKPNADWNAEVINSHALRAPRLTRWSIIYCQQDMKYTTAFIKMLLDISRNLGLQINGPRETCLRDHRIDTYLREIRNIKDDMEIIVIIFPSNRTDRYSAVKKLCCVEKPIPSQVIISRTLSRPDKLKSVTQKIALQMNCKLGGALWAVNIPFERCMVCGIDVYHPGPREGRRRSVAGFVASMDKLLTSWYSKICFQETNQDLVDALQICFIASINAYKKHNGTNPDRIIVYRDGVGDGQIEVVIKYEVKQLLTTLARIDPNYKPFVSVVIVQKRINTRLFDSRQRELVNPDPGTVIDSCITRANFYDFFLVPQSVRHGTVTPTHYIVAYDGSNMKTDHIQRFTYKLCHLYYNWPGTIRVPAPCQYAHRLVSLVGQNIQMEPDPSLNDYLFYL